MSRSNADTVLAAADTERGDTTRSNIFYGWWIVAVVFLTQCVSGGIGFSSMGVFLSVLTESLGWTRAQVSWGISLIALGAMVYAPIIGRVVDRFGPRWVQVTGALIMAIAFALLRGMQTKPEFYLLMTLLSLGVSTIHVPGAIVVANWFVRQRGKAMGISIAGAALGAFVFPPLAQFLVAHFGWRNAFGVLGAIAVVLVIPPVALVMARRPEDIGLHPDGNAAEATPASVLEASGEYSVTPQAAARHGNFWLITIAFALIAVAVTGILMHEVSILRDRGIAASTAALVLGITAGMGVPGKVGFGYLLDKFGTKAVTVACFGLQAAGALLLVLAVSPPMMALFVVVYGFAAGGTGTLMGSIVGQCFGRLYYGAIYGRMTSFMVIGHAIGAPLFGVIRDVAGNYTPALAIVMVTDLVAAFCVTRLELPTHANASSVEMRAPGAVGLQR